MGAGTLAAQSDLFAGQPDYFGGDEDPNHPLTYEQQMAKEQAWAAAHPGMGYQPNPQSVQGIVDQNRARYNDPRTWSNSEGFQLGGTRASQESMYNELAGMWRGAQGRQAPQGDPMLGLAARGDQQVAMNLWADAAAGRGPSAAQAMYQNNANAAMANSASMAAGARGGGPAAVAAQRAAMMGGASQMASAANQASQLRAQEMQAAMGGYSSAAQGIRGQDSQWAMDQARLQADQMARNDAMQLAAAHEYMGGREQDANRGASNYWNNRNDIRGLEANSREYDMRQEDRTNATIAAGLKGMGGIAGSFATAGGGGYNGKGPY